MFPRALAPPGFTGSPLAPLDRGSYSLTATVHSDERSMPGECCGLRLRLSDNSHAEPRTKADGPKPRRAETASSCHPALRDLDAAKLCTTRTMLDLPDQPSQITKRRVISCDCLHLLLAGRRKAVNKQSQVRLTAKVKASPIRLFGQWPGCGSQGDGVEAWKMRDVRSCRREVTSTDDRSPAPRIRARSKTCATYAD